MVYSQQMTVNRELSSKEANLAGKVDECVIGAHNFEAAMGLLMPYFGGLMSMIHGECWPMAVS